MIAQSRFERTFQTSLISTENIREELTLHAPRRYNIPSVRSGIKDIGKSNYKISPFGE